MRITVRMPWRFTNHAPAKLMSNSTLRVSSHPNAPATLNITISSATGTAMIRRSTSKNTTAS